MLILNEGDTEEENTKKGSSRKKKKEKLYQLSKTQTASKLESSVIKKSEKYISLKKDYNWKQIFGGEKCLIATNSKKKTNFILFYFLFYFFFRIKQNIFLGKTFKNRFTKILCTFFENFFFLKIKVIGFHGKQNCKYHRL